MTPLLRLTPALAVCALASAAAAQAPAAPAPSAAVAPAAAAVADASAAPVNDQAAQDRIMALVRAGKCGPAKTEATRVGDLSLAEQIGTMCGARSSDPFAKRSSGGGSGSKRGGRGG